MKIKNRCVRPNASGRAYRFGLVSSCWLFSFVLSNQLRNSAKPQYIARALFVFRFSRLAFTLDNVAQHVFHFEFGSAYLLRNEAGCSHTRRSVDFEQVDLLLARFAAQDVVDADNAVASRQL